LKCCFFAKKKEKKGLKHIKYFEPEGVEK
jgi:hypothetical protein